MADEIDVSQAESDFLLSLRLSKRKQYQGQSAVSCIDCGDQIPVARRMALPGVQYCVHCSERAELSGSR
ncbi:TraR/DksA C4-type zinc finger protein (plasmid) [Providencia sp. R33]|uniref:TraR/DksA C4-type zinc finger protein n=1 Tax=Providencia sp. R33 TaxID=2828763 RepID=UPI001C5B38AF|nr:TraR/DksA C4-type zinc finger protein [Providencia sp. R33]QXX85106.1 TraR/DksA C4-type zinc finger protein [Providencia sp. R33]